MRLGLLQRDLRRLLTDPGAQCSTHYAEQLKSSNRLVLLQECILNWRELTIETSCPLTSRMLTVKRTRISKVANLKRGSSPFSEVLARDFLTGLSAHDDPLIASIAQFELALLDLREGHSEPRTIQWKTEPNEVLAVLLFGGSLDEVRPGAYLMTVSPDIPGGFRVDLEMEP